jgi:hypothetical protein
LPGEHLDGDLQDARQQFVQIKFLGQGAGYFKQVISLSDAKIRKHRVF